MRDPVPIPPHLLEDVERAATRAFTEAISESDASSSLERIDDIRTRLRDALDAALAPQMRMHNARLSLQNRLPPEVWLNVWERLPMAARINISHVCSFWRELSVNSPDLWTALECTIGQPIPPKDRTPDFYSSLGLVTMALPRAKGRPLYLTISLHPVYMHGRAFDQLLAILRPHVGEVVEMDIRNCSLLEFLNILGDLQPFPLLRHLRYGAVTLQAYGPLPPLFSRPLLFPHLKTIVLPAERQYYWGWDSTISNDGGPVLCPREPPFPAVETVCFAPAHEADIAQVLHDCPSLKSLFLSLSDFPWTGGSVDGMHSHENQLTDLHLYGVRANHIQDAVGLCSAHSSMQYLSVMIRDIPRLTRVPDMRPGTPQIVLQPWADDSYIPPWPSTPSLPPSVHSVPLEPAATDGAQATSSGSRAPSGPKRLYWRLTKSAKGMFRKRTPEDQPQPEPSNRPSSPPAPPSIPHTPYPPDVTYDGTGLAHLSEHFRDLADPVDVALCTTSDGWQSSSSPTTHITLRATDSAGRTRTGGLRQSDSDAVPEFLAHVWRAVRPRHVACEVELFPLLLASLEDSSPARSLDLLFSLRHCDLFGATVSYPIPAAPMPQFPDLHTLRLAPRSADSAVRTVHSTRDIAAFLNVHGAELPLEVITFCQGVIENSMGAPGSSADSVEFRADPSHGLFYR